ncbi:hypothetical protein [Streptomyces puniciscabiei]|uniref:hypothetical protein n=1 Tax=Streptomyces puniciscabiei TaxID=164348 RepID=UPI000A999799|nr:hypothetical protein [Streptomyces puniciscabiei]
MSRTLRGWRGVQALSQWTRIDWAGQVKQLPKHESWLNIAETELSALTRQCLDRRIGDLDTLNTELSARQNVTNTDQRQVDWQFTTHAARIKLRHLYPRH